MRTRLGTVIVALFLGWLWIHKFYLWQYWMWFLYLIFCWTWIPLFLSFIEVFYFAFMTKETFDSTYNMDYLIKRKQFENLNLNK